MKEVAFEWISNIDVPFLTIDSQRRIYLNTDARKLLELEPYDLIYIGFDSINERLVLAKPSEINPPEVKPFPLDRRYYMNARRFVSKLGLERRVPLKFVYIGKSVEGYPKNSYVFQLDKDESEETE